MTTLETPYGNIVLTDFDQEIALRLHDPARRAFTREIMHFYLSHACVALPNGIHAFLFKFRSNPAIDTPENAPSEDSAPAPILLQFAELGPCGELVPMPHGELRQIYTADTPTIVAALEKAAALPPRVYANETPRTHNKVTRLNVVPNPANGHSAAASCDRPVFPPDPKSGKPLETIPPPTP